MNNTQKLERLCQDHRPKQKIHISHKKYELKTACHISELEAVFRLRYQSFLNQNESSKQDYDQIDIDEFDTLCDHLIIKEIETEKIVGTYRLLCSKYSESFYSEKEFEIDSFLSHADVKLELGRACIDPDYRNGHIIDLLWRGIALYAQKVEARFLFGCSSVSGTDEKKAYDLYHYFRSQNKIVETPYQVAADFSFGVSFEAASDLVQGQVKKWVPSLLRSYLNAGALVSGVPAKDKEFNCMDFLTILDLNQLAPTYRKRYFS